MEKKLNFLKILYLSNKFPSDEINVALGNLSINYLSSTNDNLGNGPINTWHELLILLG